MFILVQSLFTNTDVVNYTKNIETPCHVNAVPNDFFRDRLLYLPGICLSSIQLLVKTDTCGYW